MNTFSMVSGPVKRMGERIYNDANNNVGVLKFSAIYGANAAGKSKFVDALLLMVKIVINGFKENMSNCYFKLDPAYADEPSYLEVELLLDGKVYAYGFTFLAKTSKLISEWLYELKGKREILIFNKDILTNKMETSIDPNNKSLMEALKVYKNEFKEKNDELFLSYLYGKEKLMDNINFLPIKSVCNWFLNCLDITTPDTYATPIDYYETSERLDELSKLLSFFDTGITKIERVECTFNEMTDGMIPSLVGRIQNDLLEAEKKGIGFHAFLRGRLNMFLIDCKKEKKTFYKITFRHECHNEIPFSSSDESEGTIRILDLAEILLTKASGKTFIVDELDRCFHPQVTMKFISLFLEMAKTKNIQLIVTTHESRLLDFDILRRDEVWFVDKKKGISSIYSLEEYNDRFDKKIDKAYLEGRYGGVPVFDTVYPCLNDGQN